MYSSGINCTGGDYVLRSLRCVISTQYVYVTMFTYAMSVTYTQLLHTMYCYMHYNTTHVYLSFYIVSSNVCITNSVKASPTIIFSTKRIHMTRKSCHRVYIDTTGAFHREYRTALSGRVRVRCGAPGKTLYPDRSFYQFRVRNTSFYGGVLHMHDI